MENYLPGLIMGFREGLEAFLIISIIIRYLDKIKQDSFKKSVFLGAGVGIGVSMLIGGGLYYLSTILDATDKIETIWASLSSLIALGLVTTFIIWMIRNGSDMTKHIQNQAALNLSKIGLIFISMLMVGREGVEIAIFSFAGGYNAIGTLIGITLSLGVAGLIYFSLLKVKISTIFNVTLIYLVFQAGYLLGFAVHDGLESLAALNILAADNPLFIKAYDLTATVFNHKDGVVGFPLYVLIGWFSNPEWLQLILQTTYVSTILAYMKFKKPAK